MRESRKWRCGPGRLAPILAGAVLIARALAGSAATAEGAEWTRWVEPNEGAFAVEVPAGWTVQGGIRRRSPIQPHNVMTLVSPGGATEMVIGNADAIEYSVPTELSYRLDFREGSPYAPNGDPMVMRRYQTGQQFAVAYGGALLGRECRQVRLLGSRERADAVPPRAAGGIPQTVTAGEAFFACSNAGHELDGYMFSVTTMTGAPQMGAIWDADMSYGFLTPHGNGGAAGYVLSHVVGSVRMNPQWVAGQRRAAGESVAAASAQLDRVLEENGRRLAESFAETRSAAQANQDEMQRLMSGFDEYETGAGERKTVPYGAANHWWSNGQGQALGTAGPNSPGMNWTPMTRVPPGQGR